LRVAAEGRDARLPNGIRELHFLKKLRKLNVFVLRPDSDIGLMIV
jgi:hypothetical protein